MKPYLIGIGGRSCSGKTTLVRELSKTYDFLSISQDKFFKRPENADHWEDPDCLRNDMLFKALLKLKNGEPAHIPSHSHTEIFDELVYPKKYIIVEGYLLFENEKLVNLFDKKVWIHVSDVDILYRRLKRDGSLKYIDKIMDPVIFQSRIYEWDQIRNSDFMICSDQSIDDMVDAFKQLVPL